MEKVVIALVSVAVGFFLNIIKDIWLLRNKKQKDIEYLAIQVGCLLDRFISGCFDVIGDDGLYHGQADENGYNKIQVYTPGFEPEKLEVDWKCLNSTLMYELLNFPIEIENADAYIEAVFEHASPPSFDEGFEARQYRYAQLGIKAFKLSAELRSLGKLPEKEFTEWSSKKVLEDEIIKIDELNKRRNEASARFFDDMEIHVAE